MSCRWWAAGELVGDSEPREAQILPARLNLRETLTHTQPNKTPESPDSPSYTKITSITLAHAILNSYTVFDFSSTSNKKLQALHFVCAFLVQTVEYDASNAKDMASFCKNLNVKKKNISEQKHGGYR